MNYLGIGDNADCGVTVVNENGKIISSINEERLNRIKLYSGIPEKAINFVTKRNEINKTLMASYNVIKITSTTKNYYQEKSFISKLLSFRFMVPIMNLYRIYQYINGRFLKRRVNKSFYKKLFKNLDSIDHHISHGAGAYYTSGHNKALIITMDAHGDTKSSMIAIGENGKIKIIKSFFWGSTIAHLYARITQYLGFKHHRHEGKITGLAAYGDPSKLYPIMSKWVWYKNGKIYAKQFLKMGFQKKKLDRYLKNYSKEDIAAAVQKVSEDVCTQFVRYWVRKTGISDIVLSGGVFANVKINQRIHEIPEVNSIYIFPQMGDGGIAAGAALAYLQKLPYKLKHVYLGPSFSNEEIEQELKKYNLKYKYYKNIEKKVAKLITKGKVIARFNGAMEYGPRALGNRSILYHAKDPSINDWLNKRLHRTEFMPFAPVTLIEHADKCYKNIKGAEHSAQFMVICFDCTDWMKKVSPAVVHIDNTARPQLISKEINPSYYKILEEYYKLTGIPTIVNTSFNMHEQPIVCTPEDAVKSFLQGNLDYLAIGDFLIKN